MTDLKESNFGKIRNKFLFTRELILNIDVSIFEELLSFSDERLSTDSTLKTADVHLQVTEICEVSPNGLYLARFKYQYDQLYITLTTGQIIKKYEGYSRVDQSAWADDSSCFVVISEDNMAVYPVFHENEKKIHSFWHGVSSSSFTLSDAVSHLVDKLKQLMGSPQKNKDNQVCRYDRKINDNSSSSDDSLSNKEFGSNDSIKDTLSYLSISINKSFKCQEYYDGPNNVSELMLD